MAINDFLIMMSAGGTAMNFQPAGTNVWLILSASNGGNNSTEQTQVGDGAGNSELTFGPLGSGANPASAQQYNNILNSKIAINNTYYFRAPGGTPTARSWFTAVQVE
jgi:hypothetical protein